MATYPRETEEFIPVTITVEGIPVIDNVQLAVTSTASARPTTWTAATVLGGETGLMIGTYGPGIWYVWAKVADNPETPVVYCGAFRVT